LAALTGPKLGPQKFPGEQFMDSAAREFFLNLGAAFIKKRRKNPAAGRDYFRCQPLKLKWKGN
jgi:hypothetical protein